jgi:hypothetical protein
VKKKYYRLRDDTYYPNRWYLGDIVNDDNNWRYSEGTSVKIPTNELKIEVYQVGLEMDFTITNAYCVPIVSQAFKEAVSAITHLQFIPVTFDKLELSTNYYVMNINKLVDAVDEKKSDFRKFTVNDPIRPDKAGQYSSFFKLIVDEKRINGESIFRLNGSSLKIIVDEFVKSKIENFNGVDLTLVS